MVQLKLDKISDSVSGQTVVDPKGYLTDLKSVALKSGAPLGVHPLCSQAPITLAQALASCADTHGFLASALLAAGWSWHR